MVWYTGGEESDVYVFFAAAALGADVFLSEGEHLASAVESAAPDTLFVLGAGEFPTGEIRLRNSVLIVGTGGHATHLVEGSINGSFSSNNHDLVLFNLMISAGEVRAIDLSNSVLTATSVLFVNNADYKGGVINGHHSVAIVDRCSFSKNSSSDMGVIAGDQLSLFLSHTDFNQNSSSRDTSVIEIDDGELVSSYNRLCDNSTENDDSGTIHLRGSTSWTSTGDVYLSNRSGRLVIFSGDGTVAGTNFTATVSDLVSLNNTTVNEPVELRDGPVQLLNSVWANNHSEQNRFLAPSFDQLHHSGLIDYENDFNLQPFRSSTLHPLLGGSLDYTTIPCDADLSPTTGSTATAGQLIGVDLDNDGLDARFDCDDNDPTVKHRFFYPDLDLDGFGDLRFPLPFCSRYELEVLLPNTTTTWVENSIDCDDHDLTLNVGYSFFADKDGDGFGDEATEVVVCDPTALEGYSAQGGDCDDESPYVNPDATEQYNNDIDDDCDPLTLDNDRDHDGYADEEDCAPDNSAVHPGATEIPGNGVDEDCDPTNNEEAPIDTGVEPVNPTLSPEPVGCQCNQTPALPPYILPVLFVVLSRRRRRRQIT